MHEAWMHTRIVVIQWMQLKCTSILAAPRIVWMREIQIVRDAAGADDVITAQEVTTLSVAVA
jgi:hypothetical protein